MDMCAAGELALSTIHCLYQCCHWGLTAASVTATTCIFVSRVAWVTGTASLARGGEPGSQARPPWAGGARATGAAAAGGLGLRALLLLFSSVCPQERNFAAALDGAKGHTDDDYEDPELRVAEAWQSMKILPARPIKESEYADTRFFKDVMDTPLSLDAKTSIPTDGQTWNKWMRLEEAEQPISKDIRSQHAKGDKSTKGNKKPVPPPRPPITLPKKYQPLPPEPASIRPPFPQKHTFPEAQGGPRQISLKDLSEDVQHNEWYIGEYSRQAVEEALMKENKDGTFLVRDCSTKSRAEPYVLVVFYGNKVYNVKIRFLERNQQFALGTGLRGDEKFDSVEDIIEHYKYFPIILIDGKDKTGTHREQCYLTQPLPLNRHFSP
ncbi:hypothetical protein CB1_000731017 [Camelus ferus]|nr:hypothetical protein CB1_000731017 [Camelus ferus]